MSIVDWGMSNGGRLARVAAGAAFVLLGACGCVLNTRTTVGIVEYEAPATPWEDPSKWQPEHRAVMEIAKSIADRYGFVEIETSQYYRGYYSTVTTWKLGDLTMYGQLGFAGRSPRVHFQEDDVAEHTAKTNEIIQATITMFRERFGEHRAAFVTWTVR